MSWLIGWRAAGGERRANFGKERRGRPSAGKSPGLWKSGAESVDRMACGWAGRLAASASHGARVATVNGSKDSMVLSVCPPIFHLLSWFIRMNCGKVPATSASVSNSSLTGPAAAHCIRRRSRHRATPARVSAFLQARGCPPGLSDAGRTPFQTWLGRG